MRSFGSAPCSFANVIVFRLELGRNRGRLVALVGLAFVLDPHGLLLKLNICDFRSRPKIIVVFWQSSPGESVFSGWVAHIDCC